MQHPIHETFRLHLKSLTRTDPYSGERTIIPTPPNLVWSLDPNDAESATITPREDNCDVVAHKPGAISVYADLVVTGPDGTPRTLTAAYSFEAVDPVPDQIVIEYVPFPGLP